MGEIISLDNISFDIELIQELEAELHPVPSKSVYLNQLILERLNKCNQRYLNEFDNIIDELYKSALDSDISRLARVMNRLSKMSANIYQTELRMYENL